ncbi:hypothetical protein PLICRDRAFT_40232 [Plicaturopsis crispa FD-325 SS-3]|nr:hypothetical protein PLICRDRAFT_40232 [Plicaturopsis crispa FD-325 SS-3]
MYRRRGRGEQHMILSSSPVSIIHAAYAYLCIRVPRIAIGRRCLYLALQLSAVGEVLLVILSYFDFGLTSFRLSQGGTRLFKDT